MSYVVGVQRAGDHAFSKTAASMIELVAGHGVLDDAHFGTTVKHRSRVRRDPTAPNLRQVHLVHAELFDELGAYALTPGAIGENITTRGLDLLGLPTGATLHIGSSVLEVTGLRNPCTQLDRFAPGLLAATLGRDDAGGLVRKAGIMAVVITGGEVRPADLITLTLPPIPHRRLEIV